MVRKLVKTVLAAATLATLSLAAQPAAAQETDGDPSFLGLSVGALGLRPDKETTAAEFLLQYRSNYKLWIFKPHAGVMASTDGSFYGYGGLLVDIYFGRRFVATPSTAVGAYHQGEGKDLGHTLEFRSGLELAYRFDDRSRLGLGVYHMSNASIGDRNPGIESVTLTYAIPFDKLLGR